MKIRQGFVSNSSSSSFVVIMAGDKTLYTDGDTDVEWGGSLTIQIDELISQLEELKKAGHTTISVEHGGGYSG